MTGKEAEKRGGYSPHFLKQLIIIFHTSAKQFSLLISSVKVNLAERSVPL